MARTSRRAPRLTDVAAEAGVSLGAASKALAHPTLGAALMLIPVHAIEPLIARSGIWTTIAPTVFGFG